MRKNFLLLTMLVSTFFAFGGVKGAFKALNQYDYFKAKRKFERTYKYNPSVGAFGLATIYFREDNPFHSLDSARKYILISEQSYLETKERKRTKWAIYGWTEAGIDSLKILVSERWFDKADETHSIASFDRFLEMNPWSDRQKQATRLRDSIAFTNAVYENTAVAYDAFIKKYPKSEFLKVAKDNFYNAQFDESTTGNSEEEFAKFIQDKPNSPMRKEAEKKLYDLVTADKSSESYQYFAEKYAHTSFNSTAWKHLFEIHLTEGYSRESMEGFLAKFPDNPLKDSIQNELNFVNQTLLPFEENERFGFMNLEGETVISAVFDAIEPFHEGLSIVEKNGKIGAINRTGEFVVPADFYGVMVFENGYSLVENDIEKIGLMRRDGQLIFKTEWEDIGAPNDGFVYAEDSLGTVQFFNLIGQVQFDTTFVSASDFSNGYAKVVTEEGVNFINKKGEFILSSFYEDVEPWRDTIFIVQQDDYFGLVSDSGNVILPFDYDVIGQLSDGKAIVVMEDELAYINKNGEIVIDDELENFPNVLSKGKFRNDYAIAVRDEKYGRIDKTGKTVTRFKYDNLDVAENAIVFEQKSLWGLMDFSNEVIAPNQFDAIEILENNYFIVYKDGLVGVINAQGNEIIPMEYDRIKSLGGHFFAVSKQGVWGVNSHTLKTKIEYKKCEIFNEDLILLIRNDDKIAYFQKSSGELIEHKK